MIATILKVNIGSRWCLSARLAMKRAEPHCRAARSPAASANSASTSPIGQRPQHLLKKRNEEEEEEEEEEKL